jgi:hypothetical protein
MTIEVTSRLAYAVAKARHSFGKRRQRGAPVVVFAMAKSGSTAVAVGVRTAGLSPVFHVHDLDPDFLEEEERQYRWSGRPARVWDAQSLLDRPATIEEPWRVVSLVRDPIAQAVSAFFQPGVRRGYVNPNSTVDSLLETFDDRLEYLPLHWFESHLQPALGIDIYASEFDTDKGYEIISTPKVRLLLLRCEGLGVAPQALAELLGVASPIAVPWANVGVEKEYGALYRPFISAVRPSDAVIERAYSSRLVKRFYSPEEIDGFRTFWSDREPASESGRG